MTWNAEETRPVLVAVGAAALLTVAAWFAAVAPLVARGREAAELSAQAEAVSVELAKAKDAAGATARRLEALEREAAAAPVQLQLPGYLNRRVAELTGVAGASGLVVRGVQPQPAVTHGEVVTVPLQVSGQGTWKSLAAFLAAVHSDVRDAKVSGLLMQAEGEGADNAARFVVHVDWHARNEVQASVP